MINLKTRYLLSVLAILFLFTSSYAGAQDTSMIGIKEGDIWIYKLIENSITDENGTIVDFIISSDDDGILEINDTYDLEITGEPSSTGTYKFAYSTNYVSATGTGNLSRFGSDAIYTDWDYWSSAAENDDIFDLMNVTITNEADTFSARGQLNLDGLVNINQTLEIVYFKTAGVAKSFDMTFIKDNVTERLFVVNLTGPVATQVPGFGFILTIIALVAVPIISKKRN